MIENFSSKFKNEMIVIYVNPRTNYFKSYNAGTGETIYENFLSKKFTYGNPLLTYIATALTILECQNKKISGYIFTTDFVAHWLYEKQCMSKMLSIYSKLDNMVSKLTVKIHSQQIPEIRIWNDKWGKVGLLGVESNFEIKAEDIIKYIPKENKVIKKKRKIKPPPDAFNW